MNLYLVHAKQINEREFVPKNSYYIVAMSMEMVLKHYEDKMKEDESDLEPISIALISEQVYTFFESGKPLHELKL